MLLDFKIGMVVTTPAAGILYITEDKSYTIKDVDSDRIKITNDIGETKFYKSHYFMEADVYYSMIFYITLIRLFDLNSKHLK